MREGLQWKSEGAQRAEIGAESPVAKRRAHIVLKHAVPVTAGRDGTGRAGPPPRERGGAHARGTSPWGRHQGE